MPTDRKILGFANKWTKDAIKYANIITLKENVKIKIVSPTYFLATKLEAFKNRGNNDYLASHDLEDIITLIDGRQEIANEVLSANQDVRKYIANEMTLLINNRDFKEALPGHINYGTLLKDRLKLVLEKLNILAEG